MKELNYIYFIFLTVWSLKLLFQKSGKVLNPLDSGEYVYFEGPELFWVLLFSTGTIALSASGVIDLQAIRLMSLEVMCLIGMLFCIKKKPAWSPVTICYSIYLLWLSYGLTYTAAPAYGFRYILKYLYPFLILVFATAAVRNEEVFFKACIWGRRIALVALVVSFIPHGRDLVPGVFWYGTAMAIHFIPFCIFSLALYLFYGRSKKDLAMAILFVVPCVAWVFRTSIAGTAIALMVFVFFKYKWISLPYILAVLMLAVLAVFYIPSVKEKMFKDSENVQVTDVISGNVSEENINSNGRFAMWEDLQNRLYKNHELRGSGIGSVQHYMYTHTVYGGLKQPHCDYVQMKCDSGIIGMMLYVVIYVCMICHCFVIYNRRRSTDAIRVGAITAASTMAGMAFCMYSDNVVTYSMATLYVPFAFYGMTIGLMKKADEDFGSNSTL